jgi:cation diffusion facilitator CzcD-associated flavoprotein CzcO
MNIGIIGAGPGGLALGIMLSRAGFDSFTIFDREDGVGGTKAAHWDPDSQMWCLSTASGERHQRFSPADFRFAAPATSAAEAVTVAERDVR